MNNVIYTKVSVFRNLKDYKFMPKLEANKKQEIETKLADALTGFSKIDLNSASEQIKQYISSKLMVQTKSNVVFLNQKNNLAVTLFDGEHIAISGVDENYDVKCFEKTKEVSDMLSNKLNLAFSDQYGYLMSDLTKIGSGIRIESAIDLNAINQLEKIEQLKRNISKLGYSLTETKDENVYILSTVCNLGFSENEVNCEFEKTLNKLQDLELESAQMLDVENHDNFLDNALRSLAILSSAHLLTYDELKKHISTLRLGLNLGLIDLNIKTINRLQELVNGKTMEFISKSELIDLAGKVKSILKGE